jgi:hypothetical protein
MPMIKVAFEGQKLFDWEGNAKDVPVINREVTRLATLAGASPQRLLERTLSGMKNHNGSFFGPKEAMQAELMIVLWGVLAMPTHHPRYPGSFADYLETREFEFDIKVDSQNRTVTVEMLGGFKPH